MALAGSSGARPPVIKSFKDVLQGSPAPEGCAISYERGDVDGNPALFISDVDILTLAKPFALTLIGKFASSRPPITAIRRFVLRLKFSGNVCVDQHDALNVVFRFSDENDYNRFFLHRYYSVFGVEMKVVKWSPFSNISEELPIVPVWINFPGLRYHLFNKATLLQLGRFFGNPLCVDSSTASLGNMSKARVLVEIDVTRDLPDKIWIGSRESGAFQCAVVENRPPYCKNCKFFGHVPSSCPKSMPLEDPLVPAPAVQDGLGAPIFEQGRSQSNPLEGEGPEDGAPLEEGEIPGVDVVQEGVDVGSEDEGLILVGQGIDEVGKLALEACPTLAESTVNENLREPYAGCVADVQSPGVFLDVEDQVDVEPGSPPSPPFLGTVGDSPPASPSRDCLANPNPNLIFSNSLNYGHLASPVRNTRSKSKQGPELTEEVSVSKKKGRPKKDKGPRNIALDAISNPPNVNG